MKRFIGLVTLLVLFSSMESHGAAWRVFGNGTVRGWARVAFPLGFSAFGIHGIHCEEGPRKVGVFGMSSAPKPQNIERAEGVVAKMSLCGVPLGLEKRDDMCPEVMDTKEALDAFLSAVTDPSYLCLWAVQGGRMALRFWPLLDTHRESIPKTMPLLVGFSDVTSLHLWLNEHGIWTLHAPVLAFCKETGGVCNQQTSIVRDVLPLVLRKVDHVSYTGIVPINGAALDSTEITAPLMGGNLSSLHYWSVAYGPLQRSHVLMIEIWDDVTRMASILDSLKFGSFFDNAKAIIFGSMHGKNPGDEEFEAIEDRVDLMLERFARDLRIPVFRTRRVVEKKTDLLFGHGQHNMPLPFGTNAVIKMEKGEATLTASVPPIIKVSSK